MHAHASGLAPPSSAATNWPNTFFVLAKKAQRYDEALEVLGLVQDQNTPKVLNYRGYATRKLGRLEEGIGYYLKSVSLDPKYAQVREYLGEAYVSQGKLDLAREQLAAIEAITGKDNEEYEDLAEAIADAEKPGAPGKMQAVAAVTAFILRA